MSATLAVRRRARIASAVRSLFKRRGLEHDHGEVARGAGLVLVGGDRRRLPRGLDRLVLHRGFLLEQGERRQIVLDFLEAR